MKHARIILSIAILLFLSTLGAQEIDPASVREEMKRVANWQIEHYRDAYTNPQPHHPLDWTNGALYVGMTKWAAMADDDRYYNWLRTVGEEHGWKLHHRKYHADDHTVGQMYLELYRKYGEEQMLAPTRRQFDFILYHPSLSSLSWQSPYHQDRWNWCDALFMSPPVWAKLARITGEEKYLEFMMEEFRATTDFLFDKKESLYYRDESYIGKLDKGTKIFWSRGNGWVFAGLANILGELEPGSKEYRYFLGIYKKMASRLVEIQTPEGHWAMSLLGQEFYPTPETSGSSFFIFGLAYGINRGILDREVFEPAVRRGWKAMTACISEEGYLGYVQPIGAGPGKAWPNRTEVYGTGAFLSAGSEVYRLYSPKGN